MNKAKNDEHRLLLLEARAGKIDALEKLMNEFKPLVTKVARRYFLLNGDDADLIQEGMIGLYKAFLNYRLDSDTSFESYATTCIKRNVISAVRASQNQKNLPLNNSVGVGAQGGLDLLQDDDLNDFEVSLPSDELSPEDRIVLKEQREEIVKKIKSLLSDFEIKVLKRYLDGESYKEIAKQLDKNEKSIDNAIMRIKSKLKVLEG